MAFVPIALAVAGAATTAAGMIEQGEAKSKMANYQAAVARNNAVVANQNADYAIASGVSKAEKQSLKGAATIGHEKAAIAAGGVDVNTGSPTEVLTSEREAKALDTETVLNNAQLEAYGYRANATSYTAQAGLDEAAGSQAKTAGYIGAAGSLLSNASSLGFKWSGAQGGGFASGASSLQTGNGAGWDNPDMVVAP